MAARTMSSTFPCWAASPLRRRSSCCNGSPPPCGTSKGVYRRWYKPATTFCIFRHRRRPPPAATQLGLIPSTVSTWATASSAAPFARNTAPRRSCWNWWTRPTSLGSGSASTQWPTTTPTARAESPRAVIRIRFQKISIFRVRSEWTSKTLPRSAFKPSTGNYWAWWTWHRKMVTRWRRPRGPPVAEDIREYLSRWGQWMGQVVGADCYRLDAARHVPPPFWGGATNFTGSDGTAYAVTGAQQFIPALDAGVVARTAGKQHALVFGEIFNSDPREFAAYAKAGMNLLDFTLTFNAGKVFDPAGTGDLGVVVGNPPSGDAGMGFQFGGIDLTVALAKIHNHDVNLPKSENLAYAFLLTRAGQPIVYFDGNNLAVGR